MPGADASLQWLIAPHPVEDFASTVWEKRPLLVRRGNADYYSELISLRQFDELLATNGDVARSTRLLHGGREIDSARRPTTCGTSALEHVYQHYREGATISVVHLHNRWPPLETLCRELANFFSAGCQTNIYLTPPESRGLGKHSDSHDVFVLQVSGTKQWRVSTNGSETPLPQNDAALSVIESESLEIDLHPGDLLYIPRGVTHEAKSLGSASFHLTIGVVPLTYADVLRIEINNLLDTESQYRSALPIGFDRDERAYAEAVERISALADTLRSEVSPRRPIDNAKSILTGQRDSGLKGHLLDLEISRTLDRNQRLRRRPDLHFDVSIDGDSVQISFHGKTIRLPAGAMAAVEYMATGDSFTAGDIPGLADEASRLVIAKRLLREGFLTAWVSSPSTTAASET